MLEGLCGGCKDTEQAYYSALVRFLLEVALGQLLGMRGRGT